MRFSGIVYFTIVSLSVSIESCRQENDLQLKTEQVLRVLNDNQAKVVVHIDGKEFYPDSSLFTGQVMLTDHMLSLSLVDQSEGRTMLNFGGGKWYAERPLIKEIVLRDAFNAGLKLGKLVDKERGIGEGYMMTEGRIEAVLFEPDKMVFRITGKVGKYSDFEKPESYLPLEGYIVYKKPAISWSNITGDEVFKSVKPGR